ncbi:MAG: DNA repair protein RecN [Firmicutes bacterium]|nr:DNA repair protein RecN [Bacillota bacterium]
MLNSIKITNFALIAELEVEFCKGLNVLTGETGAGKSIVLDALNFVLGERADKDQIRSGEKHTAVTAVFDISNNAGAKEAVNSFDLGSGDNLLIVSRKLTLEGKNEVRVNGSVVSLNMLRGITSLIVDVYGQHEHQSLLKPASHIEFVDGLDSAGIAAIKTRLDGQIKELNTVESNINAIGGSYEERARKLDVLGYQANELEGAKPKAGEFAELTEQMRKMQNTEKVVSGVKSALELLDLDDSLYNAKKQLSVLSSIDTETGKNSERIAGLEIELADIKAALNDLLVSYDFSQADFNEIDLRIDSYKTLARKYVCSPDELPGRLEQIRQEIELLNNGAETLGRLNKEKTRILAEIDTVCAELTALRTALSRRFEQAINPELKTLGMKSAEFKVRIGGYDDIEFMFSANLGEPLKPLVKVISGGEMSRFMLAFKAVSGASDGIGTLVFDEIDNGISGNMGQIVAEKMFEISKSAQIIAVSHLPQIAAMADTHFIIEKQTRGGKTISNIAVLNASQRIAEVARLAGGKDGSAIARSHASEMLEYAKNLKNKI